MTSDQRRDHDARAGWLGKPWPIYLDVLPSGGPVPLQYPDLGLGYSASPENEISVDERRRRGKWVEDMLEGNGEAAPAPKD